MFIKCQSIMYRQMVTKPFSRSFFHILKLKYWQMILYLHAIRSTPTNLGLQYLHPIPVSAQKDDFSQLRIQYHTIYLSYLSPIKSTLYNTPPLPTLQLSMLDPTTTTTPLQIRHRHNLHHQARPACKMLRSLPRSCLRVILLPREPGLFPLIENVVYEVFAE